MRRWSWGRNKKKNWKYQRSQDGDEQSMEGEKASVDCADCSDDLAMDSLENYCGKTLLHRGIEAILHKSLPDLEKALQCNSSLMNVTDVRSATLLHHAAKLGMTDAVKCLLKYGADVNAEDSDCSTPLHWAVEGNHKCAAIIEFLISNGAETSKLNVNQMAPLHLACSMNNPEAVEALCKVCDVNMKGDSGQSPIHYCAQKDNYDAARKLMEYKPALCHHDNYGIFPIHCAATHASRRVLDLLLTEAGKCNYTRSQLLSFTDKEDNTPLHSAVHSGSLEAVQVCLEFGAPLDVQSSSKCTPLHLACSQGALDIIQMMLKMSKSPNTLSMRDMDHMTPLHRAAMFDHTEIVNLLLDEGADIASIDEDHRTPLLLAASRAAWGTMLALINHGADINAKDTENKNMLHLAVQGGGNLDALRNKSGVEKTVFVDLLNAKDANGCTPMHYATEGGNIRSVQGLIDLGAIVNIRDKKKQSPLHFAARYGRYNSCKKLLDSKLGYQIINDTDSNGRTAIHLASMSGHKKVVALLISRGALFHRDFNGQTPMHLAAMNGYTKTMDLLFSTHNFLLDQTDDDGDTPLLCAAREGQVSSVKYLMSLGADLVINKNGEDIMDIVFSTRGTEVALAVVAHERWSEVLLPPNEKHRTPIGRLVELMPEVYMKVLDRSLTKSNVDQRSENYWYKYDFQYLQPTAEDRQEYGLEMPYLPALNIMVHFNRVDLLSHPVCVKYLEMKWRAYGFYVHMGNLSLYLLFLALFTYFIVSVQLHSSPMAHPNCTSHSTEHPNWIECMTLWQTISLFFILIFGSLGIIKEILQICGQGLRYFLDPVNSSEWVLYVTTVMFGIHFIFPRVPSYWNLGAIAMFSAWYNLMLYLRRFDSVGIYIVMFLEIFKTLIHVLSVFLVLIVAFAMAFFILMANEENQAFSTPPLSVIRVITMMAGELDFMSSFLEPATDNDPNTLMYPHLSLFFLVILIILLPILLMNLLIGLAVGDIASVQKDAKLKRLAMQVELHTELEQKLPFYILRRVDKQSITVYPNRICGGEGGVIAKSWRYLKTRAGLTDGEVDRFKIDLNCTKTMAEFDKMKLRVKHILAQQEKQYELLRLVVQKMEIQTEADEQDEGYANPYKTKISELRSRPHLTEVVRDTLTKAKLKAMISHKRSAPPDSPGGITPVETPESASPVVTRNNIV